MKLKENLIHIKVMKMSNINVIHMLTLFIYLKIPFN